MEKQTNTQDKSQMKGYDKTNRNFQATDQDIKADEQSHGKLQPEKYPVDKVEDNNSAKNTSPNNTK